MADVDVWSHGLEADQSVGFGPGNLYLAGVVWETLSLVEMRHLHQWTQVDGVGVDIVPFPSGRLDQVGP